MTGIERLRGVAHVWNNGELRSIADQIERETEERSARLYDMRLGEETDVCELFGVEPVDDPLTSLRRHVENLNDTIENLRLELGEARDPAADVSMSAYDLLPQEDRDAIAWVREHGGLERVNLERDQLYGVLRETCDLLDVSYFGVWTTDAQSIWRKFDWYKARLGESVPRSYAKRRIASRQRQIDESHAALRRRNARIAELEQECDELREMVRSLNALTDEMEKRRMPEGMEWLVEAWPRFEDDAPVRFGDMALIDGAADMVEAVQLWVHGKPVIYGDGGSQQLEKGERIKRPAPKVLDADGAEIRVGDTVWTDYGDGPWTVTKITTAHAWHVYGESDELGSLDMPPSTLTHRAPVLAADGKPLREGDTVWYRDHIDPLEVRGISTTESGAQYVKAYNDYEGEVSAPAEDFTHERSVVDTWERLEEDVSDVIYDIGFHLGDYSPSDFKEKGDSVQDRVRDIVRRAKKLAERDR